MSRIFVTGDTHGNIDTMKLNTRMWPEQKDLTRDDYLIVCGDFGLLFNYRETGVSVPACPEDTCWSRDEIWLYKWYCEKPYTILWVDGNHESFDRLKKYPVTEWHGGKVQKISDNIIHLMRGQYYDIDGKMFFTMGGARSHDRGYATHTEDIDRGRWWWDEEMPSKEEYDEARKNLEAHDNKVDFIVTHDAPFQLRMQLGLGSDELVDFLGEIKDKVDYSYWFCGHLHHEIDYVNISVLYDRIVEIADWAYQTEEEQIREAPEGRR